HLKLHDVDRSRQSLPVEPGAIAAAEIFEVKGAALCAQQRVPPREVLVIQTELLHRIAAQLEGLTALKLEQPGRALRPAPHHGDARDRRSRRGNPLLGL